MVYEAVADLRTTIRCSDSLALARHCENGGAQGAIRWNVRASPSDVRGPSTSSGFSTVIHRDR